MNRAHNHFIQSALLYNVSLREVSDLVVIVVPRKEVLGRLAPKRGVVLFELLIFHVTPLLIDVLLVEVVLSRWDKRSLHSLVF